MGFICVLFLLYSPLSSSRVSVMFDFNASLNDVVPMSPILLAIGLLKIEKKTELLIHVVCVLFFTAKNELSKFCV